MARFKYSNANWTEFRTLPGLEELDFHRNDSEKRYKDEPRATFYSSDMQYVWDETLNKLRDAQTRGVPWLLITHGKSTSFGWKTTTSRSQVRKLMRSKEATPFIIRSECIQHDSVFLAAIRPTPHS